MAQRAFQLPRPHIPSAGQPISCLNWASVRVVGWRSEGAGQPETSLQAKVMNQTRTGKMKEMTNAPGLQNVLEAVQDEEHTVSLLTDRETRSPASSQQPSTW